MERRKRGVVMRESAARWWRRACWSSAVLGVTAALVVGESGGAGGATQGRASGLPPLPGGIAQRGHLTVGVKCDLPPFGSVDATGRHVGYDVAVAQQLSDLAFGRPDRLRYVCVTTTSRIPTLQRGRVDMIIATLSWTKARAKTIGYSTPYFEATGRLLVRNGGGINGLADLGGKTVVTTRGSVYVTWARSCLRGTSVQQTKGTQAAVASVSSGHASAFLYDDAYLEGVAAGDAGLMLTPDSFLPIPWGIGVKKNATALRTWIDAALASMQADDRFYKILQNEVPASQLSAFADQVPRPQVTLAYPSKKNPLTDCQAH